MKFSLLFLASGALVAAKSSTTTTKLFLPNLQAHDKDSNVNLLASSRGETRLGTGTGTIWAVACTPEAKACADGYDVYTIGENSMRYTASGLGSEQECTYTPSKTGYCTRSTMIAPSQAMESTSILTLNKEALREAFRVVTITDVLSALPTDGSSPSLNSLNTESKGEEPERPEMLFPYPETNNPLSWIWWFVKAMFSWEMFSSWLSTMVIAMILKQAMKKIQAVCFPANEGEAEGGVAATETQELQEKAE